jgi:hypothetical protein
MPAFASFLAHHRSWVLVAATLLGVVAAGGLDPSSPKVREPAPAFLVADLVPSVFPEAQAAPTVEIRIAANEPGAPKAAEAPVPAAPDATRPEDEEPATPAPKKKKRKSTATVGIDIDEDTGKIHVDGGREFESFEAFVQQAPWIAGLVFAVTFLVFLTPILIIALVIWYKMRKNRMLNETMIKLAEKGVVPTSEAFDAVAGGRTSALQDGPSTAPLYEQAKVVRQRAAWSDLRKGVILGTVGLGFTFYSMLDDGSPNFIGLVLLFLGLGYIVLWYFEDRQTSMLRDLPRPPAPPSPPSA